MTKPRDLYAELGVSRTATTAEVRKAYRRLAKTAHPDAGGDAAAFGRLQVAHDVLTDEGRRAKYDATGEIEEAQPQNEVAQVLELLAMMLGNILMADPDPAQLDLVAMLGGVLRKEIAEFKARQAKIKQARERTEVIAARFHRKDAGENAMAALIGGKIREADGVLRQIDDAIAVRERAVLFLADYRFEAVVPPPVVHFAQATNTAFTAYGLGNIFTR